MKFDTALREYVLQRIGEIGGADLVIGIPAYNSEETIVGVMSAAYAGLERYYPDARSVLYISDGGSLDYTRELAQETKSAKVPKIVAIYRGLSGKGTALRAVFQAAERLGAKACAVFDSDLRSIAPEWVPALLDPVLSHGFDFVSPFYVRHKYDATITNHVAYAMTRALYGKRVRQPIGGDFAFSRSLVEFFTHADVWDSDVAKFGVDIWATTVALNEGFKTCEAHLGAKVHDPKDPVTHLGPMFRQVVGTLFGMMPRYEAVWRRVRGSEPIPLLGTPSNVEPPPLTPSIERLHNNFRSGYEHFSPLWREILSTETFNKLSRVADLQYPEPASFSHEMWAHIVYDFAYSYLRWSRDRYKLVETMTPIYYGRIASFIVQTSNMSAVDADQVVEDQAEVFEAEKAYFLERLASWETAINPV
jgi:glycosyltransferase involved in cell wall biosynthesis